MRVMDFEVKKGKLRPPGPSNSEAPTLGFYKCIVLLDYMSSDVKGECPNARLRRCLAGSGAEHLSACRRESDCANRPDRATPVVHRRRGLFAGSNAPRAP